MANTGVGGWVGGRGGEGVKVMGALQGGCFGGFGKFEKGKAYGTLDSWECARKALLLCILVWVSPARNS